MAKIVKTLIVGASLGLGISAIATSPAFAASLTNAIITGSAPYLTYDADSTNTFLVPNSGAPTWANERKALTGDLASPTGNVELFSNSEQINNANFATYTGVTNLEGQIGGKDITLSSLTLSDWNSPVGGKTLGRAWFDAALTANGLGSLVVNPLATQAFDLFVSKGGFQRFSDPNISYVNQDDSTGLIKIGLAGHLNARDLLFPIVPSNLQALIPNTVQASELVKYTYNGQTGYLYSFTGVPSNLVEKGDQKSHTATYEVTLQGIPPTTSVPEPSVVLSLAGLGSLLATHRKLKKA